MAQFNAFLLFFLAVTFLVVHGNYAIGDKGIVYLRDQLLKLAKPTLELGIK